MANEAIAAIATPPGRGGIGVVRISGPQLGPMLCALVGKATIPRRASRVNFLAGDGSVIDQGLVLFFSAPHSYTGEDVIELQGHGGPVVLHLVLQRCLELGARIADPGEFTKRAYLNDKLDLAHDLLAKFGDRLVLPVDHVVSAEFREGAPCETVTEIPDGMMGLDIGEQTVANFSAIIAGAKTIIWNGPMGVFEKPPFDRGTMALARAVAASDAISVVGGGDSEKAIKTAGLSDQISHVSTGGGASLEFLSGIELPGVAALTNR